MAGYATLAERARAEHDPARLDAALAGAARLQALHAEMSADPFYPHPLIATAAADHATWTAETSRLHGRTDSDQWQCAAEEWIRLRRPHRAAYALWRQAEALLETGRTSEAEPVLRHAATLAANMIPLQQRITALALK